MTYEEFKKEIKAKRLSGTWYTFVGDVNDKRVVLKGYKTWLQVYNVDGIRYGGCSDISVKQFNSELEAPFK